MLAACLLACIGPASRALRINPTDALREACTAKATSPARTCGPHPL